MPQAGGRKDFSSVMVHKYTFLSEFQRRKTVFGVRNAIPSSPQRDIYSEAGAGPVQMLSTEPAQSSPAHVPHPAGAGGERLWA